MAKSVMVFPATSPWLFLARRLLLVAVLFASLVITSRAKGQGNSVSMGITNLIIQGELNQTRSSVPFQLVAAPAYVFSITGNVHGVGPVYSALVPTSEPVSTAFEEISKGMSSALQGSVSNPGSQLPSTILNEQVTSGTNGAFNALFTISLDSSGVATFNVTNVAVVHNGQADTTDQLVFDSGTVTVTALFQDVSVATLTSTNVTARGATLEGGVVCPNPVQVYFVYGTGTSLSGTSTMVSLPASATTEIFSIPVTGLQPHQTYNFAAVGADVTGPSYGVEDRFTTGDIAPLAASISAFAGTQPLMIPVLASAINPANDPLKVTNVASGATGNAAVTSGGAAVTYHFTSSAAPADRFSYTIADKFGSSSTGQVQVLNYATLAGTYAGVLGNSALIPPVDGFMRVRLAATGRFTGTVIIGGASYPFSGGLDWAGKSSITLTSAAVRGAGVTLALVRAGAGYSLNGQVTGAGLPVTAMMQPAAGGVPGVSGLYTVVIPPSDTSLYAGSGYATMQVASTGLATIAGAMPDGAPFSCQAVVDVTGSAAIFCPLYSPTNPGSLFGTLALTGSNQTLVTGTLNWIKPINATAQLDAGPFTYTLAPSGARYTPPVRVAALQLGTLNNEGHVTLSEGNLNTPIQAALSIGSNSAVSVAASAAGKLALSIQTKTGVLSGSFIDPGTGQKRLIHGVVVQGSESAAGFFLGSTTSGSVQIGH